LGLTSSGLHTNGYSLARKLFFDIAKFDVDSKLPELKQTLGKELLAPHINYTKPILNLLKNGVKINGMAHITGGGLIENVPRILPSNCSVLIDRTSWQRPSIFNLMQKIGNLDNFQLHQTFNMGIGFVLVANKKYVNDIQMHLSQYNNFKTHIIGKVLLGDRKVEFE